MAVRQRENHDSHRRDGGKGQDRKNGAN